MTLIPINREGGRVKALGVYGVGKKREMKLITALGRDFNKVGQINL